MEPHICQLRRDSISHLTKIFPDAPWKQKSTRRIRKMFLVSINHPEVFQYLKSKAAIEKESQRQVKLGRFVIHPLSEFAKYWNVVVFLAMISHLILTPLVIGFIADYSNPTEEILMTADFACCFILMIDVLLAFNTGFIDEKTSTIILEAFEIAKKYSRNLFPDLIGCVPFIYSAVELYDDKQPSLHGGFIIYMLVVMLLILYRFSRCMKCFSGILPMFRISEKKMIIFTLAFRSFFYWHLVACARRLIPLYINSFDAPETFDVPFGNPKRNPIYSKLTLLEDPTGSQEVAIDDMDREDNLEKLGIFPMLSIYWRAMFVTLKLVFQCGYTEETADSLYDMLFTTLVMFVGLAYAMYVLILLSNLIMAASSSRCKFDEMLQEIDAYCIHYQLSRELTNKIKSFYKYKYKDHYFNEAAIKRSTPASLQKEILMHSCKHLIAKVPLFRKIPVNLLENIIVCLKKEIYFEGDEITRAGSLGFEMFFIFHGTAAIVLPPNQRIGTLYDGAHFGEITLLFKGKKRIASVVALEMCEIFRLSQRDFRRVIEPYPEILEEMREIAKERMEKCTQLSSRGADSVNFEM